jgi:hypothetical protein
MAASPGGPNVLLYLREDALSVHGQVEAFPCCLCGIVLTDARREREKMFSISV